jgi:hypothetical protein
MEGHSDGVFSVGNVRNAAVLSPVLIRRFCFLSVFIFEIIFTLCIYFSSYSFRRLHLFGSGTYCDDLRQEIALLILCVYRSLHTLLLLRLEWGSGLLLK